MKSGVVNPQHRKFCEIFYRLWMEQAAKGVRNPRVGRQAAMLAGYGKNSWCASRATEVADVIYNRLTKRPEIIQYLKELGLERIGRHWQKTAS